MTSAFSPVIQRAGSPRVTSTRRSSSSSANNFKRSGRQTNSLLGQPLELVVENSREEQGGESPIPPDHVSTSGSEGPDGSNASQGPKILDFLGATYEVASFFTSCFPCAVVDIDEQDGRVAGNLSKENAMNIMYNSPTKVEASSDEPLPEKAQEGNYHQQHYNNARPTPYVGSPRIGAVASGVMYTHLPIMTVEDSDHIRSKGSAHKLRVIEDDEATEVETVSVASEGPVSPIHSHGRKKYAIVPKKMKKLFGGGSSSSKKKKGAVMRN